MGWVHGDFFSSFLPNFLQRISKSKQICYLTNKTIFLLKLFYALCTFFP